MNESGFLEEKNSWKFQGREPFIITFYLILVILRKPEIVLVGLNQTFLKMKKTVKQIMIQIHTYIHIYGYIIREDNKNGHFHNGGHYSGCKWQLLAVTQGNILANKA